LLKDYLQDKSLTAIQNHHTSHKINIIPMLKKGDTVKWKFRNGETNGVITKIHTKDFTFMSRQRRASEDEPQFEVISEKTGKTAVHKASALKKI
jgi:hypothetical protein